MWYAVSRLFEGCHLDQPAEANLWEESIVLVAADSEADARALAEQLGKADECEFTAGTGDLVQWRFRGIESAYAIDESVLGSGTELFSRFLRASEATSLLAPIGDTAQPQPAERH